MSSVQRFQLGPDAAPIRQGRSSHGRWRAAVQPAGQAPATPGAADVVLDVIQDADRLAFALAEGPAAALVAEHLTDRLWTRGSDGDDWPAPVLDWLTDGDTFASAAVACQAPRCQGQVAGQLQQLTVVVARRVGRHQLRPELSRCSI